MFWFGVGTISERKEFNSCICIVCFIFCLTLLNTSPVTEQQLTSTWNTDNKREHGIKPNDPDSLKIKKNKQKSVDFWKWNARKYFKYRTYHQSSSKEASVVLRVTSRLITYTLSLNPLVLFSLTDSGLIKYLWNDYSKRHNVVGRGYAETCKT